MNNKSPYPLKIQPAKLTGHAITQRYSSKEYFAGVAEEWDEIRSGFFNEAMRDAAVRKAGIPSGAIVADVGTGTGFVLRGLLEQAGELTGFDESPQMLDIARSSFAGYPHVQFRQAEGQHLPAEDNSFDAVFANMYLHHAPVPALAIVEMVRILKPSGRLVITDLDTHEEAWMREAMSDRWLGFERDDVQIWYKAAGLSKIDIDCAEGTCDCTGPQENDISLSIFVAIGKK
jgi:ubiquinone/menaquinone biosynthesis C-methylase UbiE